MAQFGPAEVGPHRGEVSAGSAEVGQERHLAKLGVLDDRYQKALARTKVVQQHSVTGADGGGHVTKAPVADAAGRKFLTSSSSSVGANSVRSANHRRGAVAQTGP